jgi:antitoxin MazE
MQRFSLSIVDERNRRLTLPRYAHHFLPVRSAPLPFAANIRPPPALQGQQPSQHNWIYNCDRISVSEQRMQVAKWGNSLAIRLPAKIVEALELREGDDIEVRVVQERIFEIAKRPGRQALIERLRAFRGKLPADFVFDRDDANARD